MKYFGIIVGMILMINEVKFGVVNFMVNLMWLGWVELLKIQ